MPGAFDRIRSPTNISPHAKAAACFTMFVDNTTMAKTLSQNPNINPNPNPNQPHPRLDTSAGATTFGLWRLVLVQNLPFSDARRSGLVRYAYDTAYPRRIETASVCSVSVPSRYCQLHNMPRYYEGHAFACTWIQMIRAFFLLVHKLLTSDTRHCGLVVLERS